MQLAADAFCVCLDLDEVYPGVDMHVTEHDLRILRLAAAHPEGRIGFDISPVGTLRFIPLTSAPEVEAEDALPKLEDMGLLKREIHRSYVLTPEGWEWALQGVREA